MPSGVILNTMPQPPAQEFPVPPIFVVPYRLPALSIMRPPVGPVPSSPPWKEWIVVIVPSVASL